MERLSVFSKNPNERMSVTQKLDDDQTSVKSLGHLSVLTGFESVVNEWEAIQKLELI